MNYCARGSQLESHSLAAQNAQDRSRRPVMNAVQAPDTIIFVHLPKCGGTTLNRLIEWEYPPTRVFSIDPSFFRWSYQRLLKTPAARLARMKIIQGHMPFGVHRMLPQRSTYITLLRDPVDRGISEYYYALSRVVHPQHRMMKHLTLDKYVEMTPYANVQTKLLAGEYSGYDFLAGECNEETLERAKQNLAEHFALVGLTENFDETLALAKIKFGWQIPMYVNFNATRGRPSKRSVPFDIRNTISERYSYDVRLYEYAVALFNQNLSHDSSRVQEELKTIRAAKSLTVAGSYYFRTVSAARKAISRLHSYI
jgi:Galactose-3-O-sulfotransferase